MKHIHTSSATGNAIWWQEELEYYGLKFNGPNTYKIGYGHWVEIVKCGKDSPPKGFDLDKAHVSMRKYAYGNKFFGILVKFW